MRIGIDAMRFLSFTGLSLMSNKTPINPEKLLAQIDLSIRSALSNHELRSLFDYGWQDEQTVDPDYIGLAKWAQDGLHSPFQPDETDNYYDKDRFQSLTIIVTELEALMELSRLAVGNALWQSKLAGADAFDDNHHFWLNHINSMTLLGMCSDRLRDLLLVVIFNKTFDEYVQEGKGRRIGGMDARWYQCPFIEAQTVVGNVAAMSVLAAALPLAERIYTARRERNETVHEVATRGGKLTKKLFESFDSGAASSLNKSYNSNLAAWELALSQNRLHVDSSLIFVIGWYRDLVALSSKVFDVEHNLRKSRITGV